MEADNMINTCEGCGEQPIDCACHGPLIKWGSVRKVTFNAYTTDRPIFETITCYVFGDDGRHLHIQIPGDAVRKIASSRVIMIEGATR